MLFELLDMFFDNDVVFVNFREVSLYKNDLRN